MCCTWYLYGEFENLYLIRFMRVKTHTSAVEKSCNSNVMHYADLFNEP